MRSKYVRMKQGLLLAACVVVAMTQGNIAHARLGGFEADDGYKSFLNDVAKYNAGQWGVNSGGGSYAIIPDNSGLWMKLQGPLVPLQGAAIPQFSAYATGHQNLDRTNPSTAAQALMITTNTDGWTAGPQEYSYTLDSFDLGGVIPSTTGGQLVDISFWSCASIPGINEIGTGGGLAPGTIGNTVSFYDALTNLGVEVGYIQPPSTITTPTFDYVAYNVNGTWVQTTHLVNPHTYHRWDVSLDLVAQTVTIDLFNNSILSNIVTNVPLINAMTNMTELRFESTAGVNNDKRWALDDFVMIARVPEPNSFILALFGILGLAVTFRRAYATRKN